MKKPYIPALFLAVPLCLSLLSACQRTAPPPATSPPPPDPPAQSQPAPVPEPLPELEPTPKPEPVLDPPPISNPEPVPDPNPVSEPESAPQSKPEPLPQPEPESTPEPEPELVPEPNSEPENTKLYVLMYHHFVPEGGYCNTWTVTDTRFREDLQWMADHGYSTVLPSQLAAGEPLPQRAVMLTLDDGYDSNYRLAYPLLQEYQSKAVISVIVSYIGDPERDYLSWDMCREMVQSGLVEIGSHTYACHEGENGIKRMDGECREDYEARVLPDLQASIDLIQEHVGTAPVFFAYPNGLTDKWASDFLREHFKVTVITRHGSWDLSKGLYGMKRCNVSMEVPVSQILPS